jgi:hypothetical protein
MSNGSGEIIIIWLQKPHAGKPYEKYHSLWFLLVELKESSLKIETPEANAQVWYLLS